MNNGAAKWEDSSFFGGGRGGDAIVRDGSQQTGERKLLDGAIPRRLIRISQTVNGTLGLLETSELWKSAIEIEQKSGDSEAGGKLYPFEACSVSGDSVWSPLEFGG